MIKIEIEYEGHLRCQARHTPSGNCITTDAPFDNHGKGESFSPTDLVASALGTCIITVMGIVAQRHDVQLSGSKVLVEKHMSSDAPRRIARLPVVVHVETERPLEDKIRKILEEAAHHCPVHASLHPEIDSPIEFRYATHE